MTNTNPNPTARRALIVEDDTLVGVGLKSHLEKLGHAVVVYQRQVPFERARCIATSLWSVRGMSERLSTRRITSREGTMPRPRVRANCRQTCSGTSRGTTKVDPQLRHVISGIGSRFLSLKTLQSA